VAVSENQNPAEDEHTPFRELGRVWRTHQQYRKSPAPGILGVAGFSIGLTIAMVTEDFALAGYWWAVLIPLGVAGGLAYNHLSEIPGEYGRLQVTVHEHGVSVHPEKGANVTVSPVVLGAPQGEELQRGTPNLALVWTPDGSDERVATPLDSFSASGALRRALVDGEFSEDPKRTRLALLSVGGVALASLYVWMLLPGPDVVPEDRAEQREELAAFCDDEEAVFADAPVYEGSGPHALMTAQEWGLSGDGPGLDPWSVEVAEYEDVSLIACGEVTGTQIATCEYTDDAFGVGPTAATLGAIVLDYEYEVYEAATHRHVGTVRFSAEEPEDWECPQTVPDFKEVIDISAESEEFDDAFADIVMGEADS
jgi:hypothetical protein